MKNEFIQKFIKGGMLAVVAGGVSLGSLSAQVPHELLYAINYNNGVLDEIFSMYADQPGVRFNPVAVMGLQANERLQGIDYWNGAIYGVGSFGNLYTINPNNGQATPLGSSFTTPMVGTYFGVDNTYAGVMVVSDQRNMWLVDRGTGALISTNMASQGSLTALAFNPGSQVLYAIDTANGNLGRLDPVTGTYTQIGSLGLGVPGGSRRNGFDVNSLLYLGTPAASGDPQANLYYVDPGTGNATLIGLIGAPGENVLISGLTLIPEPGALALLGLGGLGLLLGVWRRRK